MVIDKYEFHEPPEALLARIEAMHASDKHAERWTKAWGCGCGLAGLALIGLVIFIDSMSVHERGPMWWFVAIPVAFCILAIVKLVKHTQRDLDDRKVATLRRLFVVLRADLPAGRPVRLRVDFRPYKDGGKTVSEQGSKFGPKSAAYAHEWLRVRAALADGTVAELALNDDVKRKEKPKRKQNKVKERITGEATVVLRLAKQYGDAGAVAERLRAMAPPPGWTLSGVKGAGRRLQVSLRTGTYLKVSSRRQNFENGKLADGDTLLQSLRWVYRGMAPRS